eukprot:7905746-Karenia_brevis.AAC.1
MYLFECGAPVARTTSKIPVNYVTLELDQQQVVHVLPGSTIHCKQFVLECRACLAGLQEWIDEGVVRVHRKQEHPDRCRMTISVRSDAAGM